MASLNEVDMPGVKIEMDAAENPEPLWTTPHESSGIPNDLTANGSPANQSTGSKAWNPSATVIKSDPDSQTDSGHGVKAKPTDHPVSCACDSIHLFHSVDKKEENVDVQCELGTYVDASSLSLHCWNAVDCDSSEPDSRSWNDGSSMSTVAANIRSNVTRTKAVAANICSDVIKTEAVTANIGRDVIKTEAVTANIGSDVTKTEAVAANIGCDVIKINVVTSNMGGDVIRREEMANLTVMCDAVKSDRVSCRGRAVDRPAGDQQKQEPLGSVKEESPDRPTAAYVPVPPTPDTDNSSGLLQSLNTSQAHQNSSASSVLFNSSGPLNTLLQGDTLYIMFPLPSAPDRGQKVGEKNRKRHV